MTEAIIVAIIAAAASIGGQVIISARSRREMDAKDAAREQKQADRLDAIETRLDEHNHYAERFGEIAVSIAEIRNDLKWLKDREGR